MTEHRPTAGQMFEELAAEHLERPQAGRRRMFGRDCLTLHGRMVAFLHDDQLALKLPPATATALLASGTAITPHMGERPMRNWISVPLSDDPAKHDHWRQLLADASAHVEDKRPIPRSAGAGADHATGRGEADVVHDVIAESRFADLVAHFADHPGVDVPDALADRRGFGSGALKVHGSIFAMLVEGKLVLKLPRHRVEYLIAHGAGGPFTAGKRRPMKEWITITTEDNAMWRTLTREAFDFVATARRR